MKNIRNHVLLQLVILIYASTSITSKLASNESILSFNFCLYYGLMLFSLFIYAILWQQMLKRFSLSVAYACKATTIIWSMIIGYIAFEESVSTFNIIGAIVVMIGIVVMVKGERGNE